MEPSVLAASVMQSRTDIVTIPSLLQEEKEGGGNNSTPKLEFPAGWKKPNKKYGGEKPQMIIDVDDGIGTRPDLTNVNNELINKVVQRKQQITTPGYSMKVRDGYLQTQGAQGAMEEQQQKIIIKKIIRRRRPSNKQQQQQQQQQTNGGKEQEAARRQQQQQQQQQAAAAEAERQRKAAADAERQRQAAAAAAAAQQQQQQQQQPTQKVVTFQNLGTDPAMVKAELYYESTRWGPLGHGDKPVSVGSFPGHRWFIVANGMYAKLFTVGQEDKQTFTF